MRRAAASLLALAMVACARPGAAAGPTVGGPVSPPVREGTVPVVATDGSLWYAHGGDLVRLDPGGATHAVATGVHGPQELRLAPSTGGTVWFAAITEPGPGRVTTVVGRAGPRGIASRLTLPSDTTIDPAAVGAARDGALWAHEVRAPWAGGRVDGVLRVGLDGAVGRVQGFIAGTIVPGAGDTVWVGTQSSLGHLAPAGALATYPLPSVPDLVPRPDGGVAIAVPSAGPDACLAGSATDAGLDLDGEHPLIDNRGRPPLYSGTYGCFATYGGADGSLWEAVRPEQYGHGGALARGPWDLYRVRPDGERAHLTLPSGDYVAAMAPGPGGAMWFVSGRRHALGVVTARGDVREGLATAPRIGDTPGEARLVPTDGTTLYLVADDTVRLVTVPR